MLACSAMVACTNEDPIDNGNENTSLNGKGEAYLAVKILDANGGESRAANGSDYDYSTTEHEIETAHFYFYDQSGKYVSYAIADLDPQDKNEATTVESVTTSVLVLKNLTSTNYPKYVVAVLNQPEMYSNLSLAELQEKLSSSAQVGGTKYNNNFVMVNSTAKITGEGGKYFATEIAPEKFLKEPVDALNSANTVNIYVERLAAKVLTKVESTAKGAGDATVTLANNIATFPLGSDFNIDGVDNKVLKAKITNWGLNATNKKSYVIKKVHANFTADKDTKNNNEVEAWGYSDASLYRSWWAQSPNYGAGSYPLAYASGDYVSDDMEAGELAEDYSLDYITWERLAINLGSNDYCAENTNTSTILEDGNFHAKATEALLKATIVDGNDMPVDLFRYDNTLYTAKGYLERLFNKAEGINIYKQDATNTNKYKAISSEDVFDFTVDNADFDTMLENKGDGQVTVKTFTSLVTSGDWYLKNANGEFEKITATEAAEGVEAKSVESKVLEAVNNAFASIFSAEANPENIAYAHAYHYNDGMMYYNIPIEHYRTNVASSVYNENGVVDVVEGEFGVVRNHYYQLNITSVTKLGAAVHDATEEIVPDKDANITYCVGATINILAWKVVNQNVNL